MPLASVSKITHDALAFIALIFVEPAKLEAEVTVE
jgi:hypothetical protein